MRIESKERKNFLCERIDEQNLDSMKSIQLKFICGDLLQGSISCCVWMFGYFSLRFRLAFRFALTASSDLLCRYAFLVDNISQKVNVKQDSLALHKLRSLCNFVIKITQNTMFPFFRFYLLEILLAKKQSHCVYDVRTLNALWSLHWSQIYWVL